MIAPPTYWSDGRAYPSTGDLGTLASEIARAISLDITLLRLCDADRLELGLNGRPPCVRGHAFLSPLGDNSGANAPFRVTGTARRSAYLVELRQTFWAYRRSVFASDDDLFEPSGVEDEGKAPVVFRAAHARRTRLSDGACTRVAFASSSIVRGSGPRISARPRRATTWIDWTTNALGQISSISPGKSCLPF